MQTVLVGFMDQTGQDYPNIVAGFIKLNQKGNVFHNKMLFCFVCKTKLLFRE